MSTPQDAHHRLTLYQTLKATRHTATVASICIVLSERDGHTTTALSTDKGGFLS